MTNQKSVFHLRSSVKQHQLRLKMRKRMRQRTKYSLLISHFYLPFLCLSNKPIITRLNQSRRLHLNLHSNQVVNERGALVPLNLLQHHHQHDRQSVWNWRLHINLQAKATISSRSQIWPWTSYKTNILSGLRGTRRLIWIRATFPHRTRSAYQHRSSTILVDSQSFCTNIRRQPHPHNLQEKDEWTNMMSALTTQRIHSLMTQSSALMNLRTLYVHELMVSTWPEVL